MALIAAGRTAQACPFCTALKPTLAQQRAEARVSALVEVESASAGGPARVKLHQALSGGNLVEAHSELAIPLDLAVSPGALLLVFGSGEAGDALDKLTWHAVPVDELSYAYFAQAPPLGLPSVERLVYFAPYLEHASDVLAEDAYLEFGHAPFDVVADSVDLLPMDRVRIWLTDPGVRGHRKGFYGLVLGLARDPQTRRENAALLRAQITAEDDDFRAGFDGILGGYLLLEGTGGLELIESRFLANPRAAVGDVRHAMTALRFYHECGREIPPELLNRAMRRLFARPEFAEAAITDLARWQDWQALPEVRDLYGRSEYAQAGIRRAIVGYLLACPEPAATEALAQLRASDPQGVAEAEQVLLRTGSVPQVR